MNFKSAPYRIPRYLLARIAAEEYVRAFWWFVLIPPLFGIVVTVWGSGLLQAIGIFGLMWPLTIPARAILGGWKAGTFFSKGVTLEILDHTLLFHGAEGKGMQLPMASIRKVDERHGFVLLRFGIGNFVAIPEGILGDEKLEIGVRE